jgi:NADPH2:quinone reductase
LGDEVFGLGSPVSPVPDESGLQQYALLDAECSAKIPTGYDFDQMATIPVNAATSFSALFNEQGFGFPMPGFKKAEWDPKSETILVIGGGSNVGKMAIQYGKLIGLGKILTIASATNTSALKELGATYVIDRHQTPSEIQAQITEIVGSEGLSKIYDCVSWEHDMALSLLSPDKPGILLGLHPVDEAKKAIAERKLNVKATLILGISSFMQPLTKAFWESLPNWVANGDLAIGKYKVIEGFNLPAIEEGLDMYIDGKPVTPVVVHPWGTA